MHTILYDLSPRLCPLPCCPLLYGRCWCSREQPEQRASDLTSSCISVFQSGRDDFLIQWHPLFVTTDTDKRVGRSICLSFIGLFCGWAAGVVFEILLLPYHLLLLVFCTQHFPSLQDIFTAIQFYYMEKCIFYREYSVSLTQKYNIYFQPTLRFYHFNLKLITICSKCQSWNFLTLPTLLTKFPSNNLSCSCSSLLTGGCKRLACK